MLKYKSLFPTYTSPIGATDLTIVGLDHVALDPPLYALSWNLKNSHVFSGSF